MSLACPRKSRVQGTRRGKGLVLCLSFERLQVIQVFGATARGLVFLQVFETNQVDAQSVKLDPGAAGEAVGKRDTRYGGKNLDLQRRLAEANDPIVLQEHLWLELRHVKAKILQDLNQLAGVLIGNCYADVECAGGARVAAIRHGVAADEKILNAGGVEQFQELS